MQGNYIDIEPGAALENASEIKNIVNNIYQDMDELNTIITQNIDSSIQTDWARTLKENWTKYYNTDIPTTGEEMKLSAQNLETAVAEWKRYNQG